VSVITVGGERFAVGVEWAGEVLSGRAAGNEGAKRGTPWMVHVDGQTGFVDAADNPEGAKPLAGALRALLKGGSGDESWAAFVEEDEGPDRSVRVAAVRCVQGALLPDGDVLLVSRDEALAGIANLRSENVPIAVTPGLAGAVEGAAVIDGKAIVGAAEAVAVLVAIPKAGMSREARNRVLLMAATGGLAAAGFMWSWDLVVSIWDDWFGAKKVVVVEDRGPTTVMTVVSPAFLDDCVREFERRQVRLAAFQRVRVACHARFVPGEDWIPEELADRGVLEVHWQLRKPLRAAVYRPLAQDVLALWYRAGVDDVGNASAVSPLPSRVIEKASDAPGVPPAEFRSRLDRAFSMRGVHVEFAGWNSNIEVALRTERPLGDAVALMHSVEGLEVVAAEWTPGKGWEFRARRTRPAVLLEARFMQLAEPLAEKIREGLGQPMEVRG